MINLILLHSVRLKLAFSWVRDLSLQLWLAHGGLFKHDTNSMRWVAGRGLASLSNACLASLSSSCSSLNAGGIA